MLRSMFIELQHGICRILYDLNAAGLCKMTGIGKISARNLSSVSFTFLPAL